MANVHYFQRYSSVENTVTNNTLQLLSRIYGYSPNKGSQLLSNLTGESIEIGLEINQQVKAGNSVPDATILQRSFKILVESKVDSNISVDQLLRHADSFCREELKILLLLTKSNLPSVQLDKIEKQISELNSNVIFRQITYEDVVAFSEELFQPHEYDMIELVEDYHSYCIDVNLLNQARHTMRVPCRKSLSLNLKHGVYFQPSDRGYSDHRFIGIYSGKTVQALWELDYVVDADYINGSLFKATVTGDETDAYDEHIVDIMRSAKTMCGYDIIRDTRFFCGHVIRTDFKKVSSGGIMGARILNLKKYAVGWDDPQSLSDALRKATWT